MTDDKGLERFHANFKVTGEIRLKVAVFCDKELLFSLDMEQAGTVQAMLEREIGRAEKSAKLYGDQVRRAAKADRQ